MKGFRYLIFVILGIFLLLASSCSFNEELASSPEGEAGINPGQDKLFPVEDSLLAEHVPGQMIIGLAEGADKEGILESISGEELEAIEELNAIHVKLPAGASLIEMMELLEDNPDVVYSQPNYIYRALLTPNDPLYNNAEQWALDKIDAEAAWDETTGSTDVVIAVLDTGVDASHPDLAGKVLVSDGYNVIDDNADTSDIYGHGTHVAGIAAGIGNNSLGISGTAWGAPILPVKVLDDNGSGSDITVFYGLFTAINYAYYHPGKRVVINLSLGGTGYSPFLKNAIDLAYQYEMVIVAAMGNDSKSVYSYPAAYQGVVAVGATTFEDERASFSNFGNWISVVAPGQDILSTVPGGGYERWDGTSMSTPYVAGAAALILSRYPSLTPGEVKAQLEGSADDLGPVGYDLEYGYGRINLDRAVSSLYPSEYGSMTIHTKYGTSDLEGVGLVLYDNTYTFMTTTVSNSDGIAKFKNLPAGSYYVETSYGGETRLFGLFQVTAGSDTSFTLNLE